MSSDWLRIVYELRVNADHWQGAKVYPFAQGPFPANTQTLGDGMLHQLSQTTHYWWCWLAIGVSIAYILLLNVLIVILLTVLPRKLLHSLPLCRLSPSSSAGFVITQLCLLVFCCY